MDQFDHVDWGLAVYHKIMNNYMNKNTITDLTAAQRKDLLAFLMCTNGEYADFENQTTSVHTSNMIDD